MDLQNCKPILEVKLKLIARIIAQLARFLTGVEIHPGAKIGKRLVIDHGMGVVIGETAIIGDDCLLYHGVTLGGRVMKKGMRRHPELKNRVIVGANASILGGITVDDDAKIGADAVVIENVAKGAVYVGQSAKATEQFSQIEYYL